MNDTDRELLIAALIAERNGYEQRGMDDRAAQVTARLKELGEAGATPAARATKRPARTTRAKENR